MKQSAGSFIKSPDVAKCLDDDTLIAKTILGISTLQLDMMGKLKKLEENQNTILEESRLERSKHNAIVDALEKHYDKEMGRFMEMVNILVENINRRDQLNSSQLSDSTRITSQNIPRTNAVPNITPGIIPPFQGLNIAAPSFFPNQNVVQHGVPNSLQPASGFPNSQNVGHQQISSLQQLLQSSQYHLLQQQLVHAQAQQQAAGQTHQFPQAQQVSTVPLNAVRGMQVGNMALDAASFSPTVASQSNAKSVVPPTVTSVPVGQKPSVVTTLPTFKPVAQELMQTNASPSFKPVGSGSVFGGTSSSFVSFGSVANDNKALPSADKSFQSVANEASGKVGFSSPMKAPSPSKEFNSGKQADDVEEFVPTAHFEPVIPLPALIDAKTGEEDEKVLFKSRAKLYRFVKASNEYKERGIGDIKILQNNDGKRRIVMRRDQVLKVCANVPLRIGMKINKKPGTENTCIWACKDYSESTEGTDECFVARFKTMQLADDFIKMFKEAVEPSDASKANGDVEKRSDASSNTCSEVKNLLSQPDTEPSTPITSGGTQGNIKKSNELAVKKVEQGFGDAFKPPPGSWECKTCYARNKATADVCPCCGSKKDGFLVSTFGTTAVTSSISASKEGTFSFGITSGVPFPKGADTATISGNMSTSNSISFGLFNSNTTTVSSGSKTTNSVSGSGLPTFSFSPLTGTKTTSSASPSSTFSFSPANVPSASKPETTVGNAATKPVFSFAKPMLPVSNTPTDVKPTFSFAASAFKAPSQDNGKDKQFSFKPVESKTSQSGLTFGGPHVFGGKPVISSTLSSKEIAGSPAGKSGNSLFGASAANSPFSGSVFGGGSSGGFSALSAKGQAENKVVKSDGDDRKLAAFQEGSFGSTEKSVFSISSKQAQKDESSAKADEDAEEFVPTAHFEPAIPLPALVETKTGEEDEKVLFKARAKLFRYVKQTNEYKERGVGEIKILQNKCGKCRVVMRRDQILKVCANAPIRPGMKISKKPNTDNACMWICRDFTDDMEGFNECFVCRFKTPQLADEFISLFQSAVGEVSQTNSKVTEGKNGSREVRNVAPSSSQAVNTSSPTEGGESGGEENEYENVKDYSVDVVIMDAFPSPMKPSERAEMKGTYSIKIRHDINAMRVSVLDESGKERLTHLICKGDKFDSTESKTLEYITTNDDGKNVKISVIFDTVQDKGEALGHLQKGMNMAAENED